MRQREVQDADKVQWVCVQALAGAGSDTAETAAERMERADGKVPVVCTPNGGEASVRIELPRGWEESVPDAELLRVISAAARARR